VVITGTLPDICYADAMSSHLRAKGIRIFDYTQFVEPLRDEIRLRAEALGRDHGVEIEFIRKKDFRKERRLKQIIAKRGDHPGLVHIFSAMEPCPSFKPWHDKKTGKTFLRGTEAKCIHYYFYFILEDLGLCYLRVPTWAPFRLQFYFNGHHYLASLLQRKGLSYELLENAFVEVEDFQKAQDLSDSLQVKLLHRRLDQVAKTYCPVLRHFPSGYHWTLMQVEFAMDVVFKYQRDLSPLYETITRTAIHSVKSEQVATFLGRKLQGTYQGEIGNDFHTRIEGTRIKHHMGPVSIKMYDKLGIILRIETTVNDVSFFKHHRKVEHRDGTWEMKDAPLKKSIYSLPFLRELMEAANRRYLEFISAIEDPTAGIKNLEKISEPTSDGQRTYRGFNLFLSQDLKLFEGIVRGEFHIRGFQNRSLRALLPGMCGSQVSRIFKRLKMHGLIKRVRGTYKYYLTHLGQRVATTALKLRTMFIIPSLMEPAVARI
jgi:pyoverdine/dityrosine biosynthesis protein Dit1